VKAATISRMWTSVKLRTREIRKGLAWRVAFLTVERRVFARKLRIWTTGCGAFVRFDW
jgi:hypothetical protein